MLKTPKQWFPLRTDIDLLRRTLKLQQYVGKLILDVAPTELFQLGILTSELGILLIDQSQFKVHC